MIDNRKFTHLSVICRGLILYCTARTASAFRNPATSSSPYPIHHRTPRRCPDTALRDSYTIDLSESANRDIDSMHEWAHGYGVQQHEGFALTSYDGYDFFAMAGADITAGTCILYVPSSLYLTSYGALEEFGRMEEAEKLIGSLAGAEEFPTFYLFLKVLVEYERGQDSAWYPWRET